jgi:hypothetical protein
VTADLEHYMTATTRLRAENTAMREVLEMIAHGSWTAPNAVESIVWSTRTVLKSVAYPKPDERCECGHQRMGHHYWPPSPSGHGRCYIAPPCPCQSFKAERVEREIAEP